MLSQNFHGSLHKTSDTCYVLIFKNQYGSNVVKPKLFPSHSSAMAAVYGESLASFLDYSSLSDDRALTSSRGFFLDVNIDRADTFYVRYNERFVKELTGNIDPSISIYQMFELHCASTDLPSQLTVGYFSKFRASQYAEKLLSYMRRQFGDSNERVLVSLFFQRWPFAYDAKYEAGHDFRVQRRLVLFGR